MSDKFCKSECKVCKDLCDLPFGHTDVHHWPHHDEYEESRMQERRINKVKDWTNQVESLTKQILKKQIITLGDSKISKYSNNKAGIPHELSYELTGVSYFESGCSEHKGIWQCVPDCTYSKVYETKDKSVQPSWTKIWMDVAQTISTRSYDTSLHVGSIIVAADNTQVFSVGYNGNHSGGPHHRESKEPGKSGFLHAEVNALIKCDFNTFQQKHMYVTHSPCRDCCKLIINAGIKRVVYGVQYRETSGLDLLRSSGVEVYSYDKAILMAK